MRPIATVFVLLLSTIMLGGAAPDSVPSAESTTSQTEKRIDTDRIHKRLNRLMKDDAMMGLAVAIVEDGEVTLMRGYGKTHYGGRKVTPDTVFRWASLSKGVAGTLTGVLSHEGKIDLDSAISRYATTLRLPGNGENKATVHDLLAHQLGIVPNAYDTRLEDGKDPAEIRKDLGSLKRICAPGDCHGYQNVAFDAITEIIYAATEKTYARVSEEKLFAPLGMTSASLTRADLMSEDNYARPYRKRRGDARLRADSLNDIYYKVPAAGGVNSSIRDLTTYMQAQMGLYPDVLPSEVLDKIHSPKAQTLRERNIMRRYGRRISDADYGMGWRIYDYAGHKLIGHRGAVRGYRAQILFDPELDTGVVALWNSNSRQPVGLQFEVMDMLYGLPAQDWMRLDGES